LKRRAANNFVSGKRLNHPRDMFRGKETLLELSCFSKWAARKVDITCGMQKLAKLKQLHAA